MSDKYPIDYQDKKAMWEFQLQTLELSDSYLDARRGYANALKGLKVALAIAYKNGQIERKYAEDKCYSILAENDEDCSLYLQNLIFYEGEYKGLEQVLKARAGAMSFNQSLLRTDPKEA